MSSGYKKQDFFETSEGADVKARLELMDANPGYTTTSSYSPKSELYADNLIPFVDKHMNYIRSHPRLDPQQYLANLQILTRVR